MSDAKTEPVAFLINRLVGGGQFQLAWSLIDPRLANAPSDADLLLSAANIARAQGDFDRSRNFLRQIPATAAEAAAGKHLLAILNQAPFHGEGSTTLAPVPFARFDNVLSSEDLKALRDFAIANQQRFVDAKVKAKGYVDPKARRSQVWQNVDGLPARLSDYVAAAVARNAKRLGVEAPLARQFETEIGAYQDGNFFSPHWDRGDGVTNVRRITNLFYFHADPAPFSEGLLQLYDTGPQGEYDAAAFTCFKPASNSLLQFPSQAIHAVTPVRGPVAFADSRFCVTFWAREAK